VSKLNECEVFFLKDLRFKLDSQNFDLINISAQKIIISQKFSKIKKYFNLCRNGKGTTLLDYD
jgi:hypothetical protein